MQKNGKSVYKGRCLGVIIVFVFAHKTCFYIKYCKHKQVNETMNRIRKLLHIDDIHKSGYTGKTLELPYWIPELWHIRIWRRILYAFRII